MSQLTIEYDGIHFEVEYEYSPAQDSVSIWKAPHAVLAAIPRRKSLPSTWEALT